MNLPRVPALLVLCLAGAGFAPAEVIVLNDDGGWNWLQDERAVVAGDWLLVGSVATGFRDPARAGAVELVACDLRTGARHRQVLHAADTPAAVKQWKDDHNCPALLVRPDGRVVATYAQHGREEKLYFRTSAAAGPAAPWGEERVFSLPAKSRVTFPNLVSLAAENDGRGRVLHFFRGLNGPPMPSWAWSDDAGETWTAGGVFLELPPKTIPYVKFAGNGRDTIHLAFTDGHRTNFGNGVHHLVYRAGAFWRSDGTRVGSLADGLKGTAGATRIFQCNPDSVAMISDLRLDAAGNPHVVYSVQLDTGGRRPRPIGADHRYRYARWTGREWVDREIAHAGGEVHPVADDDCTGLIALDPQDVRVVYLSTNADPSSGAPLISGADQKRHWEIFRGRSEDGGATWTWMAVTRDSNRDNIRPVVPVGPRERSIVLWLRGTMRLPDDYQLEVVGTISRRE